MHTLVAIVCGSAGKQEGAQRQQAPDKQSRVPDLTEPGRAFLLARSQVQMPLERHGSMHGALLSYRHPMLCSQTRDTIPTNTQEPLSLPPLATAATGPGGWAGCLGEPAPHKGIRPPSRRTAAGSGAGSQRNCSSHHAPRTRLHTCAHMHMHSPKLPAHKPPST